MNFTLIGTYAYPIFAFVALALIVATIAYKAYDSSESEDVQGSVKTSTTSESLTASAPAAAATPGANNNPEAEAAQDQNPTA